MNINNHTLDITVNGVPVDLFEDSVNLRINRVINDPTKVSTQQAEYSFTFNLPITPTNSKVFNYANISAKGNKFSGRFKCDVYADSILIFSGTIKVTEVTKEEFKCNLFQSKVSTLENIFGDSTMNEISWKVPFKGTSTINEVNADSSSKYFFPMVAYSLFNKVPWNTSDSGNRQYSDKYQIDYSNRFYYNTFVPSLNLVELLKKCCELKGYTLQGDILSDKIINDIYLSNYIGDEQDPLYNYGDSDMGQLSFDFDFHNTTNLTSIASMDYIEYPLNFVPPYPGLSNSVNLRNFDTAFVYNMMMNHSNAIISNIVNESKMLVNGGVQIPADGWYELEFEAEFGVSEEQGSISNVYQATGLTHDWSTDTGYKREMGNVTVDYSLEAMPVEIQILKYNTEDGDVSNLSHETIYKGDYPNEQPWWEGLSTEYVSDLRIAKRGTTPWSVFVNVTGSSEGQSVTTVVDQFNNPDFVCGLSQTTFSRSVAYRKSGYSWNSENQSEGNTKFSCSGYYIKMSQGNGVYTYKPDTTNLSVLLGAMATACVPATERRSRGKCQMMIKLRKGDMLVPFIQGRLYYDENNNPKVYQVEANGNMRIRAVAPQHISVNKLYWEMTSLFDKELNLGNFNNNQQKISDFFNDVQKAFNLSFQQDGNNIILNKNKIQNKLTAPVEIDNKVNTSDAVYSAIDFPSSIQIKWKIDTEEEGFYRSVEDNTTEEQMQSNNWKDYGDYGYQKVNISQADEAKELSESLNFSYNWNRDFKVLDYSTYDPSTSVIENYKTINIPVIGKTEWWIEGLDYEGYSKYDGRGLTQRMWFRGTQSDIEIPVNGKYNETDDWYKITSISNYKQYGNNVVYLNYNNGVNTLLGKYFNIDINSASDEVEVEVYLTPMEYKLISQGASVHFDDDIYIVNEVNGYDPTGTNPTKLILMKK